MPLVCQGRSHLVRIWGLVATSLLGTECFRQPVTGVASRRENGTIPRPYCRLTEAGGLIQYNVSFAIPLGKSTCNPFTCNKIRFFNKDLGRFIFVTTWPTEDEQHRCLCSSGNEPVFNYSFDGKPSECTWRKCWTRYSTIMALAFGVSDHPANYLDSPSHWKIRCTDNGRTFLPPFDQNVLHHLRGRGHHDIVQQIANTLGHKLIMDDETVVDAVGIAKDDVSLCGSGGFSQARQSILSRVVRFVDECGIETSDVTKDESGQPKVSSSGRSRLCQKDCQEISPSWRRPDIEAASNKCPSDRSLNELQVMASVVDVLEEAWGSCSRQTLKITSARDRCPDPSMWAHDAGYFGITADECRSAGNCWEERHRNGAHWCYLSKKNHECTTNLCPSTYFPREHRSDCVAYLLMKDFFNPNGTARKLACREAGCCWQPLEEKSVEPWCFRRPCL